jgi:two-component system sensor histidine kinase RegB
MIADDGPGFPLHLRGPIGEPYISTRAGAADHMGLGIFIAQSLLERSGARLVFDNLPEGGAHVAIIWNRANLEMVEKLRPTAAIPHTLRPPELSRGRRQRQDHGD